MSDEQVVRAVAVATISSQNKELGRRIQQAMSDAVLTATSVGITTEEKNTDLLRHCMQAARQAVKDAWPEEVDSSVAVKSVLKLRGVIR